MNGFGGSKRPPIPPSYHRVQSFKALAATAMNIRWVGRQIPRYSLLASLLTSVTAGWSPLALRSSYRTNSLLIPSLPISTTPRANIRTMASSSDVSAADDGMHPLEALGLPSPILLGSASFTRKLILKEMGIPYHIVVRPIDEKNLGDRSKDIPADLVLALGKAKADHLVKEIQAGRCDDDLPEGKLGGGKLVLTGDQVVTCDGAILEKPESVEEAKEFVSQYPTHPPSTVGSCVLTHVPSGIQVSGVDTATVHFRSNFCGAQLVDDLLADNEPILSCAGGLMVEHPKTKANIERIDGTEDSVMGLSKDLVLRLLKEMAEELKKANLL